VIAAIMARRGDRSARVLSEVRRELPKAEIVEAHLEGIALQPPGDRT